MTKDTRDDRLRRLGDALEAHIRWQARKTPESEEEFLRRHQDLRDVLDPEDDDASIETAETTLKRDDEGPAGSSAKASEPRPPGAADSGWIGPYRILEPIGEGGMGFVHLAEQTEPIRRMVALKVIRSGRDTREMLSRFESERQTLALMSHPNIATVLDAGSSADGAPYFVMEYVRGVPITRFCDERRLTVPERLELFTQVCRGLHHAHLKGIVHRDIKPSNVLVTLPEDDAPLVKIIDFGIAKAALPRVADATFSTIPGAVIGTPEYMSPEQADRTTPEIDARTDVYALGVLLYELLVGARPFARLTGRETEVEEILRAIREQQPGSPSTRVSDVEEAEEIAKRRGSSVPELIGFLDGPLDAIVLKALEKDRNDRYRSAKELADAIGRHLRSVGEHAAPDRERLPVEKPGSVRRFSGALVPGIVISILGVAAILFAILATGNGEDARERESKVTEAASAPGDPERFRFSGQVSLVRRGRSMPVVQGGTVEVGDQLVLDIEIDRPVHVYVFNEDDAGTQATLFPLRALGLDNPLAPGKHRLPARTKAWTVSSAGGGAERFLVVASIDPVPWAESLVGEVEPARYDQVRRSFRKGLLRSANVISDIGAPEEIDRLAASSSLVSDQVPALESGEIRVEGELVRSVRLRNATD